jgi:hypothetical protein
MRNYIGKPANAVCLARSLEAKNLDLSLYSRADNWLVPRQRATPSIFSDEEKALAIALTCIAKKQGSVGAFLGINSSTITHWRSGRYISDEALAMADDFTTTLKGKLEKALQLIADELSAPEKIQKASLRDLSIGGGVIFDKLQLINGQPTTINGGHELPSAERTRAILHLMELAKQRQANQDNSITIEPNEDKPLTASASDADGCNPI